MIKNKIIKRVTHPRKYNYFIWRGIVELLYQGKKNKKVSEEIARAIGIWAAKEQNFLCVDNVTDLFYIDKVLYIKTRRPGLLIGKAGRTIEDLKNYINYSENIINNIYIIETEWNEPTLVIRDTMCIANDYL